MELTWYWLLSLATTHYIADFFIQTHPQSQKKSTSIKALTAHIITYTVSFIPVTVAMVCFMDLQPLTTQIMLIVGISFCTFVSHWITDYFTSRLAKKYFDKMEIRKGFQVVGLDQLIHAITLYATYALLFN